MGGLKEIAILLQKSNIQREDYVLSAFRCGRKKSSWQQVLCCKYHTTSASSWSSITSISTKYKKTVATAFHSQITFHTLPCPSACACPFVTREILLNISHPYYTKLYVTAPLKGSPWNFYSGVGSQNLE